jgi:Protein of unknown function (DUF2950)
MFNAAPNRRTSTSRLGATAVFFGTLLSLVACNNAPKQPAPSEAGPKTFATPEDAGTALAAATKASDRSALLLIFGPGSADIIFSGDDAQDKLAAEHFTNAYQTMNRWRNQTDGSEVLIVGADNNPFPIPLKKNGAGQWYFDSPAGKDEILSRRIGENELAVIDVMAAMADAQAQYFAQAHGGVKQYAQKFISDEGKEDGLYWKPVEGQPKSPLGPGVALASTEGFTPQAGKQQPFRGYFYRILTKQGVGAKGGAKDYIVNGKMTGGFAFIAYPAQYRDTGIATFIVDRSGVVYQKDCGQATPEFAKSMMEFNPDNTWTAVPE